MTYRGLWLVRVVLNHGLTDPNYGTPDSPSCVPQFPLTEAFQGRERISYAKGHTSGMTMYLKSQAVGRLTSRGKMVALRIASEP